MLLTLGCVGSVGLDSELLTSLGLDPMLIQDDGGNVVIAYVNNTDSPVQWRISWQLAGSDEPSSLALTVQPGETRVLSVEGTVVRLAVGSLDGWALAAVVDPTGANPKTVTFSQGALDRGVDFESGDIIRYVIAPSDNGRYTISADISHGG